MKVLKIMGDFQKIKFQNNLVIMTDSYVLLHFHNKSLKAKFLNQARTGHRQACAWFLEIDPVRERLYVCLRVCVCVSAPEAINNQWRDVA